MTTGHAGSARWQASRIDALLVLMVLSWGLNYSILKRAFLELPPPVFNALRLALSSAVFYGAIRLTRRRAVRRGPISSTFYTPHPLTRRDRFDLVWLGVVGHGVYQWCFGEGLARTAASSAALIIASTPVVVALLSVALGRERLAWLHWVGAALSMTGIYFVVGQGGAGEDTWSGDLLVAIGAICWAAYTVGGLRVMTRHSPLYVTGITMLCGTVPYVIAAIPACLRLDWHAVSATAWLLIIPAGLFSLCFAHLVWYAAVQQIGPSRTSIYANAIPLVAMLSAVLWLGESIPAATWIGTGAVIAGVVLTRLAPRRARAPEPAET